MTTSSNVRNRSQTTEPSLVTAYSAFFCITGAIAMVIGGVMRPWATLVPNGDAPNIHLYGPQPWAGLTIAMGVVALLATAMLIVSDLNPAWLGLSALTGVAGLALAIEASVSAHNKANDIASNIDPSSFFSIETGHAPLVAIAGAALLLLASVVPLLVIQAVRISTRPPMWARSSTVILPSADGATTPDLAGSNSRSCPFCAETVKAAATVCRYCGRDITPVVEGRSR